MNLLIFGYLGLWGIALVAGFIFFFVILSQRLKERKKEKQKHKDYDKY